VVCDTVKRTGTETLADFCDPWDAAVRTVTLTAGRPIVYEETKQAESFSFGQTHRDYGQSQTGDLLGCIIYRTGA
jgi:hypothetical protein